MPNTVQLLSDWYNKIYDKLSAVYALVTHPDNLVQTIVEGICQLPGVSLELLEDTSLKKWYIDVAYTNPLAEFFLNLHPEFLSISCCIMVVLLAKVGLFLNKEINNKKNEILDAALIKSKIITLVQKNSYSNTEYEVLVKEYLNSIKDSTEGLIFLLQCFINGSLEEQLFIQNTLFVWLSEKKVEDQEVCLLVLLEDIDLSLTSVRLLNKEKTLILLNFLYSLIVKNLKTQNASLIDQWYNKVKNANNFSCLRDDINNLLYQDHLFSKFSFGSKAFLVFMTAVLVLLSFIFTFSSPTRGVHIYNPIPIAMLGRPLPTMPSLYPSRTVNNASSQTVLSSGSTSITLPPARSQNDRSTALNAVRTAEVAQRGLVLIVDSSKKNKYLFEGGFSYDIDSTANVNRAVVNQFLLEHTTQTPLSVADIKGTYVKTLTKKEYTLNRVLTSKDWYQIAQKLGFDEAHATSVVIYDKTKNQLIPIDFLNQNSKNSTQYLINTEKFLHWALEKHFVPKDSAEETRLISRVKRAKLIGVKGKKDESNKVYLPEGEASNGFEKAHLFPLNLADFANIRTEGDKISETIYADPAVHRGAIDKESAWQIEVNAAKKQNLFEITYNKILLTRDNILQFKDSFEAISLNDEGKAMYLGFLAARYEHLALGEYKQICANLAYFNSSTLLDAWLASRAIDTVDDKLENLAQSIRGYQTKVLQLKNENKQSQAVKYNKKFLGTLIDNNIKIKYYLDYAKNSLGFLYSSYLTNPSNPQDTQGVPKKIINFLEERLALINLELIKWHKLNSELELPFGQDIMSDILDQIDKKRQNADKVKASVLTAGDMIDSYQNDFKKIAPTRLVKSNPFDSHALTRYSEMRLRPRGLITLGLGNFKKRGNIVIEGENDDYVVKARRAISDSQKSKPTAVSSRQKINMSVPDTNAVGNTISKAVPNDTASAIMLHNQREWRTLQEWADTAPEDATSQANK